MGLINNKKFFMNGKRNFTVFILHFQMEMARNVEITGVLNAIILLKIWHADCIIVEHNIIIRRMP